ncbi:protein adenylyltransferase SelO [Lysinibacillus sp. 54212]|uniref:protein adenylyltransferase SelO n=1 Tax=Lysinibacillus sp. 54212 TaxID=3119829 RepID=UPI002FC99F78
MSGNRWNFDNSYLQLPSVFYSTVTLNKVKNPRLVILNEALAKRLNLNIEDLKTSAAIAMFAGNELPEEAARIAQAYAGHQFGHFTMLGDGRALLIGEHVTPHNERVDIQLKGSGRTPFSRGGDGRAALGPMLREYIISEAMYALGIPTTRSLAVVTTGEEVYRQKALQGAILTRVASSHIRVGTFQYGARFTELEDLKALADYTILRHYPHVTDKENPYLSLLEEVIKAQAKLIASWQSIGFIHGVMNTDNMTISGETIDYGPCAFMDVYDPDTVFSSIDSAGRYAYGNQPSIAGWNLARFAECLLPLIHEDADSAIEEAEKVLQQFRGYFMDYFYEGMRRKLGLVEEEDMDRELIQELLSLMEQYRVDYTNTFRALADNQYPCAPLFQSTEFQKWEKRWKARLASQSISVEAALKLMQETNPAVIPRNHRVEEAIEAAQRGDFKVIHELLRVLSTPFSLGEGDVKYAEPMEDGDRPYQTYCGT